MVGSNRMHYGTSAAAAAYSWARPGLPCAIIVEPSSELPGRRVPPWRAYLRAESHMSPTRKALLGASLAMLALFASGPAASAQQSEMRARYERAAAIQASQVDHWLPNQRLSPHWIDNNRFWHERESRGG